MGQEGRRRWDKNRDMEDREGAEMRILLGLWLSITLCREAGGAVSLVIYVYTLMFMGQSHSGTLVQLLLLPMDVPK